MKSVLFASALVVAGIGLARADDDRPRTDWMPIPVVTQKLHDLGFTGITKIEADDGLWEAKGFKNGVYTKVKLILTAAKLSCSAESTTITMTTIEPKAV